MTPQQSSRKGGKSTSPAKVAAARRNGLKGGRRRALVSIREVKVEAGYRLTLTLTNGAVITRDFDAFVSRASGRLRQLRNSSFFRRVRIVEGALTWPHDLDLCPQCIIYGADWPATRRIPRQMEV